MRIISGTHKGRRLTAPRNLPVRPTTDFAKEGLFNILHHRLDMHEAKVLDLFSGTGNIAYECASRGSERVTAVDGHYGCVKFITETSETLEFPITAVKADVIKYLSSTREQFSFIFADPPYNFELEELSAIVAKVFENNLLEEEGFLIIEHTKHTDLSKVPYFEESRRYGGSVFSFFPKVEE
ncbi:putative methyltransferase [unidentified eubacterium SCB49]|nr:putative methyltransferase [unidentified eubacterium SCB49]